MLRSVFSLLPVLIAQAEAGQSSDIPSGLIKPFDLGRLLWTVGAIAIAWIAIAAVKRFTHWLSERVARRFRLTFKQLLPFCQGLILLITAVYIANLWLDFSNANFLAISGTIAVALGFAFKDFVSSVIAGAIALYEAPYRVGDRVQIGDHYGEVVGYSLRTIRLKTPDDNIVSIPHNTNWTSPISNANNGSLEAQVVTDLYLDCSTDIQAAIRILYLAAYTSKYTQLKLPITVVASETPWSTHLKLKSYPMDARDEFAYKTDLLLRAKQSFKACGIEYSRFGGPEATGGVEG
ncbi:mechanosensitive ion channel family protein [Synechococcus sp. PCC 7336]|uniref:mechanosensitive ion channel family protein n=1 Tax=Synechococcus sp. PCC 7336 TaxID=195250 RepID=UPI00034ADBFD|nr:mechanosensitive ion channel family protein [Synechococcus sp. PCC 7336]